MEPPHPTGPGYLDARRPLAFAHRGGAYHPDIEGLENTLAAFTHAVELGYTYLETDVHVTSDGVLLAFHDTVLDRVTDRTGSIADSTYDEVRQAMIGGRERVPTLGDLFDAFPGARFNIDLKSEGAVESLSRFIEEREAWDRVLVGSFSGRRMNAFRRRTGGRVATSAHPPGGRVSFARSTTKNTIANATATTSGAATTTSARLRVVMPSLTQLSDEMTA